MNKSITQLIEDISKEIAQENHIGTNLVTGHKAAYFKEMALKVAKQVREATIKECAKTIQVEHRIYDVSGEYEVELLGDEVLYDLSEPWNYFGTNVNKLSDLDLNTIEL